MMKIFVLFKESSYTCLKNKKLFNGLINPETAFYIKCISEFSVIKTLLF